MSAADSASGLPLGKRIFFVVATVLITLGLLELAVLVLFRPSTPRMDDPVEPDAVATAVQGADTLDVRTGRERAGLGFRDPSMTLHPYLGYVFLPKDRRSPDNPGHPAISISEDGFLDKEPAPRARREDRLLVGIMGGSVAGQLGTWHAKHLEAALRELPRFQQRQPEFVWLGMPGYHQPQQTIQLVYILAQGGQFDYLINVDGFNELAVPAVLNAPQGAHPLFPMNWSMVALDVPDPELRRNLGAIDYLRSERRARNASFRTSPQRWSPTMRLLRQRDDAHLARRIAAHAWQLQQFDLEEIPYFVRGPERLHIPTDDMLPELVDIWRRSSLQMRALCDAFDVRYLHVLQPNQYDSGSKTLSSEEKEKAFEEGGPYQAVIEKGYPMLREAGEQLRESGVAFHDLSKIFAGTRETLYVDNCCHFNAEGNRILADAIAHAIVESF